VIVVPGIDSRAAIEKKLGRRHVAGKVKRRATIAPFGMDEQRVDPQQVSNVVDETESSRCMDAEGNSAFDQHAANRRRNAIGAETVRPRFAGCFDEIRVFVNQSFHRAERRVGLKSLFEETTERIGHPLNYLTDTESNFRWMIRLSILLYTSLS